jgi:hypothetical protein
MTQYFRAVKQTKSALGRFLFGCLFGVLFIYE